MVGVAGVVMVVGEDGAAAAVGGKWTPGKLPVAPFNLHCPHERMGGNWKQNKNKTQKTREEENVTGLHKLKSDKIESSLKRKKTNQPQLCICHFP